VHFLQVWIIPDTRGLAPAYDQRTFDAVAARNGLVLLASKGGRNGSIDIHQDAALWVARLGERDERVHAIAPGRHAWVHVARGQATVGGHDLSEGDGLAMSDEAQVRLLGRGEAEVLLFDLA
jgi:redox-sensitive bicupin YhaK (pirin superfamily)